MSPTAMLVFGPAVLAADEARLADCNATPESAGTDASESIPERINSTLNSNFNFEFNAHQC